MAGWKMISIDITSPAEDLLFEYNGELYTWDEATTENNPEGTPLLDHNILQWIYERQEYYPVEPKIYEKNVCYWQYYYFDCKPYTIIGEPSAEISIAGIVILVLLGLLILK